MLAELQFIQNIISARISILYKRPFRKEKEVVTFLIKVLKWNLARFYNFWHRGVDHQPSKGGFLTPHIAANIVSLWHPKMAAKVAAKSEGY